MRNILFSITLFLFLIPSVRAQEKLDFDPDLAWNTLRAEYGAVIPVGTVSNKSFGHFSLSYTRRYSGRWGWRVGMQYASLETPVNNCIGLPFAAVYRFRTNSFDGRLQKALDDSVDDLSWNGGGDVPEYEKRRMRNAVVDNLLFVFLRRTELFAGITPGYLLGQESHSTKVYGTTSSAGPIWTETGFQLNNRFFLSADAGATLSIPIWRFSLDITTAAHYMFTKNVCENRLYIDPKTNTPIGQQTIKPIHWLFTLSGGLSFLF